LTSVLFRSFTLNLFHRLTRTVYLYNGCLPWYNVVLTSRVHSSVEYSQQSTVTSADSCDGGKSVLNHCLRWSKFVNTHLSHSSQWFNIHIFWAVFWADEHQKARHVRIDRVHLDCLFNTRDNVHCCYNIHHSWNVQSLSRRPGLCH